MAMSGGVAILNLARRSDLATPTKKKNFVAYGQPLIKSDRISPSSTRAASSDSPKTEDGYKKFLPNFLFIFFIILVEFILKFIRKGILTLVFFSLYI